MSGSHSLTAVEPSEYDLIESAMSESARGRWFLTEYARRNRSADTDMLLGAIHRLENVVTSERGPAEGVGRLRGDLMEMANAIARTKAEIAAISAPEQDQTRLSVASEALDAIVRATERATSDILGAAEEVQEAAWTLREHGADANICDELDRHATQIYTACSFQDLTAQRTSRIVHTLRYLEERLVAMIAIWGSDADEIPPAPGEEGARSRPSTESDLEDLCQSDVDRFIDMDAATDLPVVRTSMASVVPLHEDLTFMPSQAPEPGPASAETEAGSEDNAVVETLPAEVEPLLHEIVMEPELAVLPSEDEACSPAIAKPAIAMEEGDATPVPHAAGAESAVVIGQDDVLDFADIDALSIEEKLALFS
jgi:chemotaxis regulatin CheY-phosphate phosphatase CheZ